ncbi:hypothetical protein, partial [Frigidibacter sp. ROC022]|uniref:hypothetical protein n=1 Tax=Frigidibacter sp. ROC022 TaxID=2971796 RepID=UPI00215B5EE4
SELVSPPVHSTFLVLNPILDKAAPSTYSTYGLGDVSLYVDDQLSAAQPSSGEGNGSTAASWTDSDIYSLHAAALDAGMTSEGSGFDDAFVHHDYNFF